MRSGDCLAPAGSLAAGVCYNSSFAGGPRALLPSRLAAVIAGFVAASSRLRGSGSLVVATVLVLCCSAVPCAEAVDVEALLRVHHMLAGEHPQLAMEFLDFAAHASLSTAVLGAGAAFAVRKIVVEGLVFGAQVADSVLLPLRGDPVTHTPRASAHAVAAGLVPAGVALRIGLGADVGGDGSDPEWLQSGSCLASTTSCSSAVTFLVCGCCADLGCRCDAFEEPVVVEDGQLHSWSWDRAFWAGVLVAADPAAAIEDLRRQE